MSGIRCDMGTSGLFDKRHWTYRPDDSSTDHNSPSQPSACQLLTYYANRSDARLEQGSYALPMVSAVMTYRSMKGLSKLSGLCCLPWLDPT